MAHSPDFVALCERARARITEVQLEDYLARPEAWTLIDVREESEHAAFAVPNSVHLGKGVLERDVQKHFDKEAPLLLMCGGGYRSALSAERLQEMGFSRVASLAGGIKGWWRLLASRADTGTISGLSLREPLQLEGDLRVEGDLDLRAPLALGGRLVVEGLVEVHAPLSASAVQARAAILHRAIDAPIQAQALARPGQPVPPDLALPPAYRADWPAAVRAFARGELLL